MFLIVNIWNTFLIISFLLAIAFSPRPRLYEGDPAHVWFGILRLGTQCF